MNYLSNLIYILDYNSIYILLSLLSLINLVNRKMVQVNFSMDDELHSKMKVQAAKENIAIKRFIPKVINEYLMKKRKV